MSHVTLSTDHNNLKVFMRDQRLNHRQARWAEHLVSFPFMTVYEPDRLQGKLDTLLQTAHMRFGPESSVLESKMVS
jgi:hypothetical protein